MQKVMNHGVLNLSWGLLVSIALQIACRPIAAQGPPISPQTGMPDAAGRRTGEEQDSVQKEMMLKMQNKRSEARQQEIVKDTSKLLALATELKSAVDKTNKDVLSIDVIKKADEIEKLSRSIKERMKN